MGAVIDLPGICEGKGYKGLLHGSWVAVLIYLLIYLEEITDQALQGPNPVLLSVLSPLASKGATQNSRMGTRDPIDSSVCGSR